MVEADDIQLENLTIQNESCNQGQAVALHVEGDKFVVKHILPIGWYEWKGDTMFPNK